MKTWEYIVVYFPYLPHPHGGMLPLPLRVVFFYCQNNWGPALLSCSVVHLYWCPRAAFATHLGAAHPPSLRGAVWNFPSSHIRQCWYLSYPSILLQDECFKESFKIDRIFRQIGRHWICQWISTCIYIWSPYFHAICDIGNMMMGEYFHTNKHSLHLVSTCLRPLACQKSFSYLFLWNLANPGDMWSLNIQVMKGIGIQNYRAMTGVW